jgi:Flp pilus assembly protein TadG
MVTAETAMALPALVLVLGFALSVQAVLGARAACTDAARAGARVAARGEPDAVVAVTAQHAMPRAAGVAVTRRSGLVTVAVSARPRGPLALLPLPAVEATAVALDEGAGAGTP